MRGRALTGPAGEAGYTLLEVLVVLAILAVVGGLGLRLASGPPAGLSLSAAAETIAVAARRARLLALQRNQDVVLMLDAEKRLIWIEGGVDKTTLAKDLVLRLTTAAPERLSAEVGGIRFFADGTSTGGEVRLTRAGKLRTVKIDWLLGQASVLDE